MKLTTEKVKELLNEGKTASQIAKEYNLTRGAVYRHIRKIKKEKTTKNKETKKEYRYIII